MLVEQYEYDVDRILKFMDGDTFVAVLSHDVGFHERAQHSAKIRVLHVDTPERGQINYREASAFTQTWITEVIDQGAGILKVITHKDNDTDEFGRWLGDVFNSVTGERLSDALKAANLIKPGSVWNI